MNMLAKPPVWFWVVSALALAWNLLGVMAFVGHVLITPEMIAAMPAPDRGLYSASPGWVTVAFGVAVIGGALGSLLLLLRRRLAKPMLLASLLGVLVQMGYVFFVSRTFEVYGPGKAIMPALVILIGFALLWLAAAGQRRGWLR